MFLKLCSYLLIFKYITTLTIYYKFNIYPSADFTEKVATPTLSS